MCVTLCEIMLDILLYSVLFFIFSSETITEFYKSMDCFAYNMLETELKVYSFLSKALINKCLKELNE